MSTTQGIEQIRSKRFQFLHRCYDLSGGDELKHLSMFNIGEELGFDKSLTMQIAQYLKGEGLIKFRTMPGGIAISHSGVVHMERALSEPDAPTEYFPAVINIISAEQILGSQIQQASPAAVQVRIREDRYEQLQEAVNALKESIDQLSLAQQDVSDVKTDIQTIEAQMLKSRPNPTIITECVLSIRRILEQVAATVIGGLLLAQFNAVLGG